MEDNNKKSCVNTLGCFVWMILLASGTVFTVVSCLTSEFFNLQHTMIGLASCIALLTIGGFVVAQARKKYLRDLQDRPSSYQVNPPAKPQPLPRAGCLAVIFVLITLIVPCFFLLAFVPGGKYKYGETMSTVIPILIVLLLFSVAGYFGAKKEEEFRAIPELSAKCKVVFKPEPARHISYTITFELEDASRIVFDVTAEQYSTILEGDTGTVFYKQSGPRKRLVRFERTAHA